MEKPKPPKSRMISKNKPHTFTKNNKKQINYLECKLFYLNINIGSLNDKKHIDYVKNLILELLEESH